MTDQVSFLDDQAYELSLAEMKIRHLESALQSARRIGAAIGIVMAAVKVSEDQAFSMLSRLSQQQNRKLRDVADDIVLTGTF